MKFLYNIPSIEYFCIIEFAKERNHIKETHDGFERHHIIPRSLGGTDSEDNLVYLTWEEHKECHRLLIDMVEGEAKYKMMSAYKLFDREFQTPSPQRYCTPESYRKMVRTRKKRGSYKTGLDNNFSKPEIVEIVRKRMQLNNPMKAPEQKERMRVKNNNPHSKPITIEGKIYPSLAAAARKYNTTPHLLKKNYIIT